MDYGINNKTAFISGGSHGIGLASAKLLSIEGCNTIICSRDKNKLEIAKRECESHGTKCLIIDGDVLQEKHVDKIINFVLQYGKIDILINNVGGGGRWGKENVLDTPIHIWREVMEKNLWAAVKFTLSFLPLMIKQNWGRVITVTSIHGKEVGGRPWFNIAKTSEMALMKNLSTKKEFIQHGITFNSVAPGCIMIPNTGWDDIRKSSANFELILETYPMGRMGTAEEVASLIVFLCSNQASYINGSSITVDGGESHTF